MDNAEKQAIFKMRKRRAGFKQVHVWIRPEEVERLKKYVARLNKKPPAVRGERDD